MGGQQIPVVGSGDDGFDEEGFDESQRAEILEATQIGRGDDTIIVDLDPDLGMDDDDDTEDDMAMRDTDLGEQDDAAGQRDSARDEDEVQEAFDDGTATVDRLSDRDGAALN